MKNNPRIFSYFKEVFLQTFSVGTLENSYGNYHGERVAEEIIKTNIKRIIPLSFILGLFQIAFLVLDNVTGLYQEIGDLKYINICGLLFLFIVSVVFGGMSYFILKTRSANYKKMRFVFRVFYLFVSLAILLFILSDTLRGERSQAIYYLVVIFAVVPVFSKTEALSYLLFNSFLVLFIVLFFGNTGFTDNFNVLLVLFSGWIISFHLRANTYNILYNRFNLEELNDKLKALSLRDPLTGLPNRRALDDFVEERLCDWKSRGEKIMVLMIDIDNFKNYNDTFSHLDGDDCLCAVASAIKNALNQTEGIECFNARIGGEEFLTLIEGLSTENESISVCLKIRDSVENMHIVSGEGSLYPYITISIGCVMYDTADMDAVGGNPIEAQYRLADYQLYNAKRNGKNCVSTENVIYR